MNHSMKTPTDQDYMTCNYCQSCDWHIGWAGYDIPDVDDDAGWAAKAVAHRKNCKWIHTRAGQKSPL